MDEATLIAAVPWVLGFATIGALGFSIHTWRRRRQPGARWLALTIFTAGVWTGLDWLNYTVDQPQLEVLAKCTTWALILIAGFAFFRFAVVFARQDRWWEVLRLPVMVLLGINLLLMLTNPYHLLLWPGVRWLTLGSATVPWLESGPAFFWIFRTTACALPLAGVLALIVGAVGSPGVYTRQIAGLVIGAMFPVAVNLIFNSPTAPALDLTPVAVVVFVCAFGLSTFRFGLLDVTPVARSILLVQLDVGVIVLDEGLRVVDLNASAARLLGVESGWIPGTPAVELLSFSEALRRLIDGETEGAVEIELGGAQPVVVELTSSPVRGEEGAIRGWLILAHDVTTRVRLARELDAYAETVAGDLRAPLSSLIGALEAFRGSGNGLSEAAGRRLDGAERVSRQMRETIDALLAFAQLRSLDDADVEPLDMASVVDSALRRLSAAITTARAEIRFSSSWPAVMSHRIWVEEMWTNYISNAIKYGGRPPLVELGAAEEDERTVRCWVRDNGPGLSEEQRARLFTEFTRLEPKRSEGHGLGLSIVRRIAEKLGGEVGCSSVPGQGSTFWFTLPEGPLRASSPERGVPPP